MTQTIFKLISTVLLVLLLTLNYVQSFLVPKEEDSPLSSGPVKQHNLTKENESSVTLNSSIQVAQMDKTSIADIMHEKLKMEETQLDKSQEKLKVEEMQLDKLLLIGRQDLNKSLLIDQQGLDKSLLMGQRVLDKPLFMGQQDLDKSLLMGQQDLDKSLLMGPQDLDKSLLMGQQNPHKDPSLTGYTGFPYKYERVPHLSKKIGMLKHKAPVRVPATVSVQDHLDRDDDDKDHHLFHTFDHQPVDDVILNPNFPHLSTDDHLHHHDPRHPNHQHLRPTSQMTKTELDFIGIITAIVVKLVMSTALASWFLVAGTTLYGLAYATGTTAVFGQDSTIGYIYKTLPLVETLLRGETTFFHHHQ